MAKEENKCPACGYVLGEYEEWEQIDNIIGTQCKGDYYKYDEQTSFSIISCPQCKTIRMK